MLIGIICRYPDKENNYIYSLDEIAGYDFGLLQDCISDPDDFHISYTLNKGDRCEGLLLRDMQDIENFINGKFNSDNIVENHQWKNIVDNDIYGEKSPRMHMVLQLFKLSE